jgi:lipopolysaccharide assembly outer membrane protein LptD (OstA)
MTCKYIYLPLLILLCLSSLLYSEAEADTSSEPEISASSLLQETLPRDIETASYYELVAWCRKLELDDSGNRKTLQNRIFTYFKVKPSQEETPAGEERRSLEIKSAGESEYFTIEEIEEDYIVLRGGVEVELRDKDALHRIKAEKIILNQSADIITAQGGVEYILERGDNTEVFRGESLTFDIESWEGVFFHGGTETEREFEGQKTLFHFSGETISRLENDTIVLEKGTITSCDLAKDPHYHIKAKKIWVLAPGEWAIQNAVLYIGRVPMLYLPFFFHPGDEFFFHPAIGYRDREGNFLQTTTYLIGKKERKESPFSFLTMTQEDDQEYARKIEGLFLRKQKSEAKTQENENWFLKVMADIYSRLGGMIGLHGDFSPHITFKGGVGRTRSLFLTEEGLYTPYCSGGSSEYDSDWNDSRLFGLEIPLRWGMEASWKIGEGKFTLSGLFEHYSDPYFTSDFYNRAENIDWSRMLGMDEESELDASVSEKWNFTWELNAKGDLAPDNPLFNTVSLPYLKSKIFWQSREQQGAYSADPGRHFYYPVSIQLPSAEIHVAGKILELSSSEISTKVMADSAAENDQSTEIVSEEPGKGYLIPDFRPAAGLMVETLSEEFTGTAMLEDLRLPEAKKDIYVQPEREDLSLILSYDLRPSIIVENTLNSENWESPEDVDYESRYITMVVNDTTTLDYELNLQEGWITLNQGLAYSGTYQTRYRGTSETIVNWEDLVRSDCEQTRSDLATTMLVSFYPLMESPDFKYSFLTYKLNWIFFSAILNDGLYTPGSPVYYNRTGEWSKKTVKEHNAQCRFEYRPLERAHALTLSAQLPPLLASISGELIFYLWILKSRINSVYKEEISQDNWQLQPLVVEETLEINEEVSISEELRFDLESNLLTKSISAVNLWNFNALFTAERLIPVVWDSDEGWKEQGGTEEFMPSNIQLGYTSDPEPLFLWKNRIRLESNMKTSWNMDLRRFTENSLDFTFKLDLFIYKFLEFSFSSVHANNYTHQYFPAFTNELGEDWINPITDLLRSFNFWDINDRYRSAFKLESIAISAVHHLHDWDLTFSYEGKPVLSTENGNQEYRWESSFSIFLQWIAIPEMKSTVRGDGSSFYVRG